MREWYVELVIGGKAGVRVIVTARTLDEVGLLLKGLAIGHEIWADGEFRVDEISTRKRKGRVYWPIEELSKAWGDV